MSNNVFEQEVIYAARMTDRATGEPTYFGQFVSVAQAEIFFKENKYDEPVIVRKVISSTPWETV